MGFAGTGHLGLAGRLELVHWGLPADQNCSTMAYWLAGTGQLGLTGWLEVVHWGLLAGWNWSTCAGLTVINLLTKQFAKLVYLIMW